MTDELKARIEKTMQNLRRNRMEAYFCENSAEARELVKTLIKKGDVISNGGSVTLKQTGIYDIISSADYNYLDRSREGITREEVEFFVTTHHIIINRSCIITYPATQFIYITLTLMTCIIIISQISATTDCYQYTYCH
ncbi:MAG: LUD domain-containing protein [Ruminococcus sp.]|nr:LUD domain-containing protein [Ruminococcus sp.]